MRLLDSNVCIALVHGEDDAAATRFIEQPRQELDEAAHRHGHLRAARKRAGSQRGRNELLIGSIAVAKRLTVVTRNVGEFARIPGLRVESW